MRSQRGSLTLEFALAVPVLALLVLATLQVTVLGRDALLVHEAARAGARVAATTLSDAEVHRAVATVLGGRASQVEVTPRRRPGDLVTVTVTMAGGSGPFARPVTGRVVAQLEAIAPRGGPRPDPAGDPASARPSPWDLAP